MFVRASRSEVAAAVNEKVVGVLTGALMLRVPHGLDRGSWASVVNMPKVRRQRLGEGFSHCAAVRASRAKDSGALQRGVDVGHFACSISTAMMVNKGRLLLPRFWNL
jgi:hypothetical protein